MCDNPECHCDECTCDPCECSDETPCGCDIDHSNDWRGVV